MPRVGLVMSWILLLAYLLELDVTAVVEANVVTKSMAWLDSAFLAQVLTYIEKFVGGG